MFNNGFPVAYPQMIMQQVPQQAPQGMTPPTIRADIVQLETEQEAWNHPVQIGSSQMIMLRDESAIFIKSAYPNRQPTMDIYRKEAQKAIPAPSDYVTKQELAAALEALKTPKKSVKTEVEE